MNDSNSSSTANQPPRNQWDEFGLKPELLRGIYSCGFEYPSNIQQQAILPIIQGHDTIAQAQSGTGKTATFGISALQCINTSKPALQVLILTPTRELCGQVCGVITNLARFMPHCVVQDLYKKDLTHSHVWDRNEKPDKTDKTDKTDRNEKTDKRIPHVACGCPGRVYDMIRRGQLNCRNVRLIIMDEADEMLSSGFKEQVYDIFQRLPNNVQVGLFSATLPEGIQRITSKFMRNPVEISVKAEQLSLEGIKQYMVAVDNDWLKMDVLKDLFSHFSVSQTIIYCNSVKRVNDLWYEMKCNDFPVSKIHSKMSREERAEYFEQFRNGSSRVLISSDITARGIDIQQVSIVINYDLPKCEHTYLHRIGRSGRWGRKGVGINFVTRKDFPQLKRIESHYNITMEELPADLNCFTTLD